MAHSSPSSTSDCSPPAVTIRLPAFDDSPGVDTIVALTFGAGRRSAEALLIIEVGRRLFRIDAKARCGTSMRRHPQSIEKQ
jgi:hypothetical protein